MEVIASILTAVAILLYLLPSSFVAKGTMSHGMLFDRIEVEQKTLFQMTFSRAKRGLPGLAYLQKNKKAAEKLARMLGVEREKVSVSLQRLRWTVSIEEVLLAKVVGAGFVCLSLIYVLILMRTGRSLSTFQLIPVVAAILIFLLPTYLIERADKQAKEEIRIQIPIFFGIVQSLVEAGMPIHAAVRATARRYQTRLGREIALLEVDEKRFGNWRKALEELAYRWDVDAFVSIVMEINEALTKGVSIAPMLAVQVEEQIKQQEDEAASQTNRLQVRLIPLLVVFMGVPLMFLVMGPAFLGIGQNL